VSSRSPLFRASAGPASTTSSPLTVAISVGHLGVSIQLTLSPAFDARPSYVTAAKSPSSPFIWFNRGFTWRPHSLRPKAFRGLIRLWKANPGGCSRLALGREPTGLRPAFPSTFLPVEDPGLFLRHHPDAGRRVRFSARTSSPRKCAASYRRHRVLKSSAPSPAFNFLDLRRAIQLRGGGLPS